MTDRVKAMFLDELAVNGNVSAACRSAGVARQTAYRHQSEDHEFAEAWSDALEQATDRLELEARRRAHEGTPEPVFYQGVECGTVQRYSDTLMIQLLKAHHPAHRLTINHKHAHGGDPDAPPISSSRTVYDYKATMTREELEQAQELANKALQRGVGK